MLKLETQVNARTNVYIAAPYRGTPEEIETRMCLVSEAFSAIRNAGHFVTSPMLHHYTFSSDHDASDGTYWLAYSQHVIEAFAHYNHMTGIRSEVWLLDFPGWRKSSGVRCELETAWKWGITVRLFSIVEGVLLETQTLQPQDVIFE